MRHRRGAGHAAMAAMASALTIMLFVVDVASAAAAPSTAAPSACDLLTSGDVHAALGGTVDAGDLNTAPDGSESICEWTVTTSANGGGYGAQLDVKTPFTTKEFTQQRRIASSPTHTVKHLGDAAFSERAKVKGQIYDDLWVRTGAVAFRLEVLEDLGTKPLEQLASVVLANLAKAGS